jgi:hypothetical protein
LTAVWQWLGSQPRFRVLWPGCRGAELAGLRLEILTHGVSRMYSTSARHLRLEVQQQVHISELVVDPLYCLVIFGQFLTCPPQEKSRS